MTDHTHPDLEQRIAALESRLAEPTPAPQQRSYSLSEAVRKAGYPTQITNPHDLDPGAWARGSAAAGAQPVDVDPQPQGDDAAVQVTDDRAALVTACQNAHIRAADAMRDEVRAWDACRAKDSEIAALRDQLADAKRERDAWEADSGRMRRSRDKAMADLANASACLETSKGEARRLFEENKTIKADLAAATERADAAEASCAADQAAAVAALGELEDARTDAERLRGMLREAKPLCDVGLQSRIDAALEGKP